MTTIFNTDQVTDLESLGFTVTVNNEFEARVEVTSHSTHRIIRNGSGYDLEVDICCFNHATIEGVLGDFYDLYFDLVAQD